MSSSFKVNGRTFQWFVVNGATEYKPLLRLASETAADVLRISSDD